ncbi:tetraacyldisaccharide 4'-kinase [Parahaliea mediterranea]|uniref:Tetraacyldisaccharide 4'-kinase n=1 Tax=Parahaliea mediterranea TaxID=651086 RepID=A0A939INU4_9GAMM|nr:tetraacyldisaccharide 4'-kinase [Parahaliea mediterranea]MBN7798407.1 tetraacyldisaccharide 4'-kinase [Parahaliea mediterranea]
MAGATRIERAWYAGAPWLWLLRPLEILFRAVSALRRGLYIRGWLPSHRAGVPVVVVGNITVGGTGKTPIVIALVEALRAAGHRPGVVSRGYGGSGGAYPLAVTAASDAAQVGDEPLLIARRTGAPCVVDPDRGRAAARLEADYDVDLIISDDGLQHYRLRRDFEIAVLDAQRRTGNGWCLPAGPLREPAGRLANVDWVLLRGGDGARDGVRYLPTALVDVASGERRDFSPGALSPRVRAIAGIGQPAQFFASLRAAGFEVSETVFPDHHHFSLADLAGENTPVIMTEKDAVKCAGLLAPEDAGRYWYLCIDARLPAPLVDAVLALTARAS